MKPTYYLLLGILYGCCSLVSWSSYGQGASIKRPNIILIMVDDLGYEGVGCYGGTSYRTPNIDKLAATGMQFNEAYAQPLCSPTRLEIMTGKYTFRNWTAFGILDPDEKTFGHLMQDAGYATCIIGKWQLQSYDPVDYPGAEFRRDTGMKIEKAGFDEYCTWHIGHTEDKGSRFADPVIFQNGSFLNDTKGKYGPDIFSDYLNEYVSREREKPFFVYYPMVLTHNPFSPTPNSMTWKYPEKRFDENPGYFKDMLEYTDKIVGDIVTNLEEKGLRENTLILFYSDNGTNRAIYSNMGDKVIQGGKGLTTKAGIKVPFIANWPGQVKAGVDTDEMISAIDFLPTLLEVANVSAPDDTIIDGQSFLPVLKGEPSQRKEWIYMNYNPKPGWDKDQFAPSEFVMDRTYKLYGDGRFYNHKKDILEEEVLNVSDLDPTEEKTKMRFGHIIDSLKKYQTQGSIERLDPALDAIVSKHARIELVAEGFNWSEGPVWQPKGQKLLFSDVPENKIYQWNDLHGLQLFMSPSGYTGSSPDGGSGSNGLTLDRDGSLVLCQQGDRKIGRLVSLTDSSGPTFQSLVSDYKGKKFNSPNDLVYDKAGHLYFTDPPYGLRKDEKSDLGFNGVFFLSKEGELKLVDKDLARPNGIAVSNDGTSLYVAESHIPRPMIWKYDIVKPGMVENRRMFFDPGEVIKASTVKQNPDGMKIDKNGNVFVAAGDGILIINPQGKHIGTINTGQKTGNCEFTDDGRYLFITADELLLRVNLRPYSK